MKGFVGKMMITIVMLGLFSLIFIAFDQVYDVMKTFADDNVSDATTTDSVFLVDIAWTWLPVAVLFSFVVWSIVKPTKEREVSFV